MSKRDTFKRTIKGLTNTRSLKTAIRGWEFVHTISLPKSNAGAACELCGTRFWNGAFIRRPEKGGRKATAITVQTHRRHDLPPRGCYTGPLC